MLLETLSLRTRVSLDSLEKIAASASKRYKTYEIPKRTGGVRVISHPSKTLKAVQRWLTRNILSVAAVHDSATAYEKGRSIYANATRHAGSKYTLRMDFKDFFPSFDAKSVANFLRSLSREHNIPLTDDDIYFAVRIFCKNGRLTIGAPSSPKITNAMMYDFDVAVHDLIVDKNIIYSRYADDIFLSCFDKGQIALIMQQIRDLVSSYNKPILILNEEKTIYLSKAGHRSITGLVLTSDGRVSLGRDRKRHIRSLVYKALTKSISQVDRGFLAGMIAFASDVDSDFVNSLSQKFEIDVRELAKRL